MPIEYKEQGNETSTAILHHPMEGGDRPCTPWFSSKKQKTPIRAPRMRLFVMNKWELEKFFLEERTPSRKGKALALINIPDRSCCL